MITNQVFGVTFIILGIVTFALRDWFYTSTWRKYDVYFRQLTAFHLVCAGIWRIFIVEIQNSFVQSVNYYSSPYIVIVCSAFIIIYTVDIFRGKNPIVKK
jgi:hypothetical protein